MADSVLKKQYDAVLTSIHQSCVSAGRSIDDVQLMLVTKTVPAERIAETYQFGHRLFGENKIQELVQKKKQMVDTDIGFHFIGHLQTNKVKECIQFATSIDSVDRMGLVEELDRRLQAAGKSMDILVQVNTSHEESKYGVEPEGLLSLVRSIAKYDTLKVKGLMTLALFSSEEEKVRQCFRVLKNLSEKVKSEGLPGVEMKELSMGMSSDFKIAIEEGSTLVRVGTAVFGTRQTADSYYWPEGNKK